ncbi:hypothetical protein PoB_007540800 [Plakobranchus ocellatus]|uniref:Uncharacterized protein n=1 Tax=Plakobranchus ocellatus TaxID=259542 RepID=A0AAV4DXC2_9GAST|nr:hypothetical protein PoB_007540800 [Plakobranchus ocellatus]
MILLDKNHLDTQAPAFFTCTSPESKKMEEGDEEEEKKRRRRRRRRRKTSWKSRERGREAGDREKQQLLYSVNSKGVTGMYYAVAAPLSARVCECVWREQDLGKIIKRRRGGKAFDGSGSSGGF